MSDNIEGTKRSYGCSYGCGNPYDFVVVPVADPTSTLCLCTPCMIRTSHDMVQGFISAQEEVDARIREMGTPEQVPMNGPGVKAGHGNAPVQAEEDDLFDEFEPLDLEDE